MVPNSLCRHHILENANLGTFNMAPFRMAVFTEMSAVRSLRFCDSSALKRADQLPFTYAEIKERGLAYLDDGTVIEPGSDYEYIELSVEIFERLELGDLSELLVEPKEINGVFPGVDVEPVE